MKKTIWNFSPVRDSTIWIKHSLNLTAIGQSTRSARSMKSMQNFLRFCVA